MKKETMLTFFNIKDNSNKFYHIKMDDSGIVTVEYGRVRESKGVRKENKGYLGESGFNKLMKSKTNKGYVESNIVLESNDSSKFNILELAMSQIKTSNSKCSTLVQRLVDKNIHNITSSTAISFNINTGSFTTALGIVSKSGIIKAKSKLFEIQKYISLNNISSSNHNVNEFMELNREYFLIVPTDIPNLRDTDKYILFDDIRIKAQLDICEALLQTFELMSNMNSDKDKQDNNEEQVFQVTMDLLEDKKEFKRIETLFNKSKNLNHGNTVNNLKIDNIYSISLNDENKVFRKDMSNIMELFHGTRVVNILSILKSGLLMPKDTPGKTTGAMFGNGLYFSDQSTKSLNYCDGMFWNNSVKQDKVYLLIADVAMGNYKVPTGPTSSKPKNGYDSYYAQAARSGVRNNEMIVFNKNQIKLKYIIELS